MREIWDQALTISAQEAVVANPDYYIAQADVCVVLPTYNESPNIVPILERLSAVLSGYKWEAIFVDDNSFDGTADTIVNAARRFQNVRIIRRIGRRGLSSAIIEGIQSSMAPYIVVMDADMQHDEAILPRMLDALFSGESDLVVGTRYSGEGGIAGWSGKRRSISLFATRLSQMVIGTSLSDLMSGYFAIRRDAFEDAVHNLSGEGFKILLDIAASSKMRLRINEIGYVFRDRQFGESKLDTLVAVEYVKLLLEKTVGDYIPARFLMFAAVGGAGLLVHMTALMTSFRLLGAPFLWSQITASAIAMSFNYFINNLLTYRDQRIKGFWGNVRGLLTFGLACSFGALSNVGIAQFMFQRHYAWWVSGVTGVLIGAVWNYAATSVITWRRK